MFIYTISISILCVSWEDTRDIKSTSQVMLIYIYMGVSVYWPLCVLCVFVFVCVCVCVCVRVISSLSNSKKPCQVLDLS